VGRQDLPAPIESHWISHGTILLVIESAPLLENDDLMDYLCHHCLYNLPWIRWYLYAWV